MNQHSEPANPAEEDRLFAFGDDPNARPTDDIEITFRRVQRASGIESTRSSTIPTDLKHQIWEDLVSSNAAVTTDVQMLPRRVAELAPPVPITPPRTGGSRWNTAANALLAAALIFALSAGIWRVTGGVNFGLGGGEPNQPTIPFGGFVHQEATPSDVAVDPATLPKAEDCTVEPLTVDEVIWYTQNPDEAARSLSIDNPVPPTPEWTPATPPAKDTVVQYSGPANAEDIAAIDAQQRMLMSCILADSWFQIWALEHPIAVSEQVSRVVPRLAGVAEARAILEDLEANGPAANSDNPNRFYAPSAIGYAGLPTDAIAVIDTDPENTWQVGNLLDGKPSAPGDFTTNTGYNVYSEDGSFLETMTIDTDKPYSNAGCQSFLFIWNEARGIWLFSPALHCA